MQANVVAIPQDRQAPLYNKWKLKDVHTAHILACYAAHDRNKTRTAKALGIGIRTLQRKLKKLGVD